MPPPVPAPLKAMYDDYGRVDVKALASQLGEPAVRLAGYFGVAPRTLTKNPVTDRAQTAGRRLIHLLNSLLANLGDWKATMIWMRTPHPDLDEASPLELIEQGDIESVETLVWALDTGQPL